MEPIYVDTSENLVFNHNFIFANRTENFPAGWQKIHGRTTAGFSWEKDDKHDYYIKIKNRISKLTASICQERSYGMPVHEKQGWEVGAVLKVFQESSALIKVHFLSRSSSRVLYANLDFKLDPERRYYCGLVTVPSGADLALIEIGSSESGTLCIEDVLFRRVFPLEKYDINPQGQMNINNVDSITQILTPVEVNTVTSINKILELLRVENISTVQTIVSPVNVNPMDVNTVASIARIMDLEKVDKVGSVQRIIEPVNVNGTFNLIRPTADFSENVTADTTDRYSTVQDVLKLTTYSFCVINQGLVDTQVQMQLSPNGINWGEDARADGQVAAGQMKVLVYNNFARYVRLKYWTTSAATSLRIYFQGQG